MKALVKLGICITVVTFLIATIGYAQDCGSGGLTLKVTPETLVLANEGSEGSPPVIKAHIKSGASEIDDPDLLKIICINGISLSVFNLDVPAVPGMWTMTRTKKDGKDGLEVAFYRKDLVDAIKTLGVTGDVEITVGSAGGSVNLGELAIQSGVATSIYTGDLTGFTNLNLGEPSGEVSIVLSIANASWGGGSCQLGPVTSGDPQSIDLDPLYFGGCSLPDLTNATLLLTVYSNTPCPDDNPDTIDIDESKCITFTGVTLTGAGGAGVSGTDTIRVK